MYDLGGEEQICISIYCYGAALRGVEFNLLCRESNRRNKKVEKRNSLTEKFQSGCLRFAAAAGTAIFLVLTACSWYQTKTLRAGEALENNRDAVWKTAVIFLIVLFLTVGLIKAEKVISEKLLHAVAVILSFGAAAVGFLLLNSVCSYAVADQWYVYEAARRLTDGTFDVQEYAGYYLMCPYQLNLAQIYQFVFRITGNSDYRTIQGFQSICMGITFYMGFRIIRELFHRRAAELFYLISGVLFVPMYIYTLYIYGEAIGTCCAMVAIWCFLKYNSCKSLKGILGYGILGAAAVTGIYQTRVALVIVWIAMLLIQLMITIVNRKPLPFVITIGLLLTAVCVSALNRSVMEHKMDVALDNPMPAILYVAMGLQEGADPVKGPGSFNSYNWSVFAQVEHDAQAASDIASEYIGNRLGELVRNPGAAAAFFGRKMMNQWNEPAYGCFIMTGFYDEMDDWMQKLYSGEGNDRCLQFLNEYQAVMYMAVLLGFARLVFRKRNPQEYLIGVILIGEFLFSLIWEAKSRYVYPYAVMMIPFAAYSLVHCGDMIAAKGKKLVQMRHSSADHR